MADKMDTQELKKIIQNQQAALAMQELVEDMSDKCYAKCIQKPGSSLDNYEKRCLGNCMDRFIDSFNVATKAFTARLVGEMNQ